MKFDIQELTNPLTAELLAQKDFQFTSGGGGGGGATGIAPHNAAVVRSAAYNAAGGHGAWTKVGTVTIPLIGNRQLEGYATLLMLGFNAPVVPPATPEYTYNCTRIKFDYGIAITLDGAAPNPGVNTLNFIDQRHTFLFTEPGIHKTEIIPFAGSTVGLLAGNHTVDLWIYNFTMYMIDLVASSVQPGPPPPPPIPTPYDVAGTFANNLVGGILAKEFDAI